jgi:hypothetical protein
MMRGRQALKPFNRRRDAMRVANGVGGVKPETTVLMACMAAACLLAALPGVAQDERSGVARPDSTVITVDSGDASSNASTRAAKPSAAVPAMAPTKAAAETVYGPYVPYQPAGSAEPTTAESIGTAKALDPDANIVTAATAGQADRRLLSGPGASTVKANEDEGIVTYVPSRPGEIPEGSLVKVKLREDLSTLTTRPGTKFTAEVTEPVMRDGQVVVPAGSIMEGRVTWVRGGKRIGGPAAIHLEPRTVTLPDGAQYVLRARAIDTNSWENTKVDSEGTIMRSENTKRNLGLMGLTTGGGAAAGAMIGGPAGALVGAGVGAGVTTVLWLKQNRQAVLPKDLGLVFSLTEPMSVTPASARLTQPEMGRPGGE